ncbi:MAG TPA: uroporphyrinogen-III synthase [Methyloceanibacter sp.]|jgi:uroporphyrinogen-III synthase|nr:uroporphyrinogen-III synthase [Methyloceanibacter sp.]
MRLLVTRPEPDASREAETLIARGHEPVLAPLLAIEFVSGVTLGLAGAQALIVTSRNALRALASHRELEAARKLPLFAVGEATASAATKLGFAKVTQGPGTASGLPGLIGGTLSPEDGPLVHLAAETVAFELEAALRVEGFSLRQPVLYRALPARDFPAEALRLLKAGELDGAILMSPRTAKTFVQLLDRHGVVTQGKRVVCYCLSEAVAEVLAPLGIWVRVAANPREEDVLALLDSEAASS